MRRDQGFTLVEVLVALVIMTASMVALFQGVQLGGRGLDQAGRQADAVQFARSLMAQAGVVDPLEPGVRNGRSAGGMEWSISIAGRPADEGRSAFTTANAGRAPAPGDGLRPYLVTVEVSWRERTFGSMRRIQLTTVKLGGA